MQYRTDPKSGERLSVLGFGCMRFPRDAAKTEKLILDAIAGGVNYFDTAYIYPGSEATLGGILHKNNARDKINIATKLPFGRCKSYDDFDRLFKIQLERLRTDHIDYYLIHNLSDASLWRGLQDMGIERWIASMKESGQIRRIGFSFHGSRGEFLALLDAYDWDFCQIQYNYMDENYQAGRAGLRAAHQKGLPVIVMEPLLGGRLATGLPQAAAKLLRDADGDRSIASWAFRWLWDQPEVTVVLSGMNSPEQLGDNLKTAGTAEPGMLTEAEAAVYAPVIAALREAYRIPCTGCNYCMPCERGVNIPGRFAAYNTSYAMGFIPGLTMHLTSSGIGHSKKNGAGKSCVKCGACEKKCPQHIGIMGELEAVTRRLEPLWIRPILWAAGKIMR